MQFQHPPKILIFAMIIIMLLTYWANQHSALLVQLILFVVLLCKKFIWQFIEMCRFFFFKKGHVAVHAIAWKKVTFTSVLALSKRATINGVNNFIKDYIITPLIQPVRRYLLAHWRLLMASSIWHKISAAIAGVIPAGVLLWLTGVSKVLQFVLSKLSLAKFLSLILKLLLILATALRSFWRAWLQPVLDFIIITVLLNQLQRIPLLGRRIRALRVYLSRRWRRYSRWYNRQLDAQVVRRVSQLEKKIHHQTVATEQRIHRHINGQRSEKTADADVGNNTLDKENTDDLNAGLNTDRKNTRNEHAVAAKETQSNDLPPKQSND